MKMVRKIVENNYFAAIGIVFLIWFFGGDRSAIVLGDIAPAVSKLQVETIEVYRQSDIPAVKITGRATKYMNCDFIDMRWFVVNGSIEGSATSYFLDTPQGREAGLIEFSGIIVGITPDRLSQARSEVTHKCYGFKWITEFYEGEDL